MEGQEPYDGGAMVSDLATGHRRRLEDVRCYADFARVGGRQQVSLADECIDYATIIHELMHVIGFIHEHQREDRDGYVNIFYQNIIPGANSDFDKLTSLDLTYYGEPYDYLSIMHYEKNEGSRNGQNTIEAKGVFGRVQLVDAMSAIADNTPKQTHRSNANVVKDN
nr:Peptidase M12A domain containing protein [Haemonchus contortus]